MAEQHNKTVFDDDIRAFLEDVTDASLPLASEKSDILAQAATYNVDLDGLETAQNSAPDAVVAQVDNAPVQRTEQTSDIPEMANFEQIDVKLSDIVTRIFEFSHRPYVVICDDKIEYMNKAALDLIAIDNPAEVLHHNFLEFVVKEDWNKLAENIGAMLTDNAETEFMMKSQLGKTSRVKMHAIYVPDSQHFSFILVGLPPEGAAASTTQTVVNMFDASSGLPNFYLFEDRVQVAVNNENYKDVRQSRNMIAVLGVSLDNLQMFKQAKMDEFIIKKLASRLVLGLPRHYTVARGLKYQFWIMMNDISSMGDLDLEMRKLNAIFMEGVSDNITEHTINTSIGISIFPTIAKSAKKLLEQTIKATKKSQEKGGGISVFSDEDEQSAVNA